jgi:hypothetical protein
MERKENLQLKNINPHMDIHFNKLFQIHNDSLSNQDQLEFRSLESFNFMTDGKKECRENQNRSYSEDVKMFIRKILKQRDLNRVEVNRGNACILSSTPLKGCSVQTNFDISGIEWLNNEKMIQHTIKSLSLNDSEFVSMEFDQYGDDEHDDNLMECTFRNKSMKNVSLKSKVECRKGRKSFVCEKSHSPCKKRRLGKLKSLASVETSIMSELNKENEGASIVCNKCENSCLARSQSFKIFNSTDTEMDFISSSASTTKSSVASVKSIEKFTVSTKKKKKVK